MGVKDSSTTIAFGPAWKLTSFVTPRDAVREVAIGGRAPCADGLGPQSFRQTKEREMSVLVFILLTVVVFALLGVIQRAVERL
ncbi:hypothetical protein [Rhodococcus opacus]|uniref:hypothetical protein n=1 Tax=Rhodococcus opacus TaxID=37919 RepID=UPI002235A5F0|nr:hypothetical protein [Rhodococcus opacus]UZG55256.1 hypothetical protein ONE62_35385 [Rhodococcus opacus]